MGIFTYQSPFIDFDTALDIIFKIQFQRHVRKGATKVSENQYNAPAMEVVEFGKGDAVCTASTVSEVPASWEVTGP